MYILSLLDVKNISSNSSDSEDLDLPLAYTSHSAHENTAENTDPLQKAVETFRTRNVDCTIPRQLFSVCRSDGDEDLKMDIFSVYKNPNTSLRARPRVRFEGEEGVGAGPTREFLVSAIKIAQDGIGFSPKPVLYFEGETDHKLPIHNQGLRQTGSFQAIGRILGHSFLHDGPTLCGLSPAVKNYFTYKAGDDVSTNALPLEIKDIPDVELQILLEQLQGEPNSGQLPAGVSDDITPYLLEAGIDVELLHTDKKLIIQGLLIFNVIEKRKLELDDIAKGMTC